MVARYKPQLELVKTETEVDWDEAERFLEALAPGQREFEFQTFDDNPDRKAKDPSLIEDAFSDLAGWRGLAKLNRRGAGVFVAINETDGSGRKRSNVTAVRALMLDLDGSPLDPVMECGLRPHIITETSPGNFHCLWRVEGLPLDQFSGLQRGLAQRFDGDPAVDTLERCTRLPGFFHNKDRDNPFRTLVVEINDRPAYTADEIRAEFPPAEKPHKAPKSPRERSGATGDQLILPVGAPIVAAAKFVEIHRTEPVTKRRLMHYYRAGFYTFTGSYYRGLEERELRKDIYGFLQNALVETKTDIGPYNPTRNKVTEVVEGLRAQLLVDRDGEREAPLWLEPSDGLPNPRNLLVCENGILDIETRELMPHDANLLAMNCVPLVYDPKAPAPERWLKFLEEIWPDKEDEEAEDCLQEIFGYLLSNDTRQHKAFLIVGPARCGKGTMARILSELIGPNNVASQGLKSMAGEFGRWPLIDKKLALVPDARLSPRADAHAVAEQLLSISGGDVQTINRKYRDFWTGYLGVRFLLMSNELPAIPDASGVLASRFILLQIKESFLGREDKDLLTKLMPELPGILTWALDGLDRLRDRGYFVMPQSSRRALRQLENLTSPVTAFLRDWCEQGPDQIIPTKTLYDAYRCWAKDVGLRPSSNAVFGKALHSILPHLKQERPARQDRLYIGVALTDEGEDSYRELRDNENK